MIAVRVELGSPERVRLELADNFIIGPDQVLEVYKGDELVAKFRHWAYVVKVDEAPDAGEQQLSLPPSAKVVLTPPPRPLNLGASTKPLVATP